MARPVTVKSAGAVPSTIAAMMRGERKARGADLPLYRVYALDRFEELLASGDDALVNPTKLRTGMASVGRRRRKATPCGASTAPIKWA